MYAITDLSLVFSINEDRYAKRNFVSKMIKKLIRNNT